jgi:hypothetical protein
MNVVPRKENVRDVLVLAEKRQMQEDLNRLRVGCHDNELANPPIQSLGGLVGALLCLLVVGSLLDQIKERHSQLRIGERIRLAVRHDKSKIQLLLVVPEVCGDFFLTNSHQ